MNPQTPSKFKGFLGFIKRIVIYSVPLFVIMFCTAFVEDELETYILGPADAIPPLPYQTQATTMTETQKQALFADINASQKVPEAADIATKLSAMKKPKSNLSEEEKMRIMQGLE